MKIFAYAQDHPEEILAVTDSGEKIPYGEMTGLAKALEEIVGHRLVFVLCRNTPGALVGYLGLLMSGGVPLLLDSDIAPELLEELLAAYHPAFCLAPKDLPDGTRSVLNGIHAAAVLAIRGHELLRTAREGEDPALSPELRLLLTTSGSTGSQKLVRISGDNLDANAASIIEYLKITKKERPITVLPMQYSYGMSIIHTHVMVGATILLTDHTLMEKSFWERVRGERATSLCGVPYTFEMYDRLGLREMDLPALTYITQAGGKLPEKRHLQFARWCAERGIRFYVMYGQTEASPRMGWLPPEKAIEKCGSMGIAIPGGKISLIDENGREIGSTAAERDEMSPVGEIVYRGPNVALGYALSASDLAGGDAFHGVLYTGDMARRDADGYYYIVGRRSRFIKMAGRRIGLDEAEKILHTAFPDLDLACAGRDDELHVFVAAGTEGTVREDNSSLPREGVIPEKEIYACIEKMISVPERYVRIVPVNKISRSSSGQIRYADLESEKTFSTAR